MLIRCCAGEMHIDVGGKGGVLGCGRHHCPRMKDLRVFSSGRWPIQVRLQYMVSILGLQACSAKVLDALWKKCTNLALAGS